MSDYVAFSGGKDSTALCLVMQDTIPVFTDTGWEHEQVYAHIDKFERVMGREVVRIKSKKGSIPEYIRKYNYFPNYGARYCTRIFKIEAMNNWLMDKLPATLSIGLRADEPTEERIGNLSKIDGLTIRYPLREYNIGIAGVIKLCKDANLLPRYPAYMAGGGCIGCFYKSKGQILSFVHQAPEKEVKEMEELEACIQDERPKYFHAFGNIGMSIAEIKKQPLLMSANEVFAEASKVKFCGAFCGK